ncbi:coiled-coil domain-containing protein [Roseibium suaedae]|uniref:Uncharacterized protein n=1 Tax=Roseibium suaedae TaxID=735517 RepID=A0A1M7IKN9_9HYPH|nr:hypothetical protein [Roseibium suaedae]SHM41291.1 hypothetical protein SAMN05444272_2564 [Roseibium suaedae]
MIEAAMYVALGFCAATLLGLAILPAIYRRSVRLTREALEAVNPATYAEVRASHDYDRANHALKQLRLEQAIEREREKSVRHRLETGRLTTDLVKAKAAHERELSTLRIELEKALQSQAGAKGKDLIAEMERLRNQLTETETALSSTRAELDVLKSQTDSQPLQIQTWLPADDAMALATITSLESQLATARKRLAQLEGDGNVPADVLLPVSAQELQSAMVKLEADLVDAEAQFITAQAEVTRLTIQLDQTDRPIDETVQRLERDLEWADGEKARLTALINQRNRALDRARLQVQQLRRDLRSAPDLKELRGSLLDISARILDPDGKSKRPASAPGLAAAPATAPAFTHDDIPHALVSRIVNASRANSSEDIAPQAQVTSQEQSVEDEGKTTGNPSKKDVA